MKNPLRRLSEKTKQSHSCLSFSLSGEPESEEKAKALKGHALKMHFLDEIESGRRNELETEWAFDRCDVFQCFNVCCCSENFAENIEEDRKLLWQNKANCYLNFRDLLLVTFDCFISSTGIPQLWSFVLDFRQSVEHHGVLTETFMHHDLKYQVSGSPFSEPT